MEERKRAFMEACEGAGPRCLVRAMDSSGPATRRHTRGGGAALWVCLLLKGSEVCLSLLLLLLHARIQMEVGELSGMLAHTSDCLSAGTA